MKKLEKAGYVKIDLCDLDSVSFTDMSFFESKIPEGTKLVQFYHEYGAYDQGDYAYITIEWSRE
jgi:hypothetical protein